ncbi:MAG: chorismate mutase [Chloroflexi bacterium]|nr:chorismate mutase [Chloroflexota bacterium]
MTIYCRGVRGATTVERDTAEDILEATREMLQELIRRNDIVADDVASAIFTTTPDLRAEFPAVAARQLGWTDVALLCGHEMTRPGSLGRCIRVLIHLNTTKTAQQIQHIYLREAVNLRPDRATVTVVDSNGVAAPPTTTTTGGN